MSNNQQKRFDVLHFHYQIDDDANLYHVRIYSGYSRGYIGTVSFPLSSAKKIAGEFPWIPKDLVKARIKRDFGITFNHYTCQIGG